MRFRSGRDAQIVFHRGEARETSAPLTWVSIGLYAATGGAINSPTPRERFLERPTESFSREGAFSASD
jgi:hypothetical protein